MDEDKIIDYTPGNISNQPSHPDDVKIGVDRFGHDVFRRKDGTRYAVYPQATKTVYSAKINPNSETEWWDEGNIARDEYGRRFSGNTQEEAQAKYEAWKRMQGATHGNWSGPEMFNALTGGIFNQLSPTQLARNLYNIAVQDPNYAEQFINGNNGLVSDEFAANNPLTSAFINLIGDGVILGGPSAVRNAGNVGRAVVRSAKPVVENMKQVVDNARNYANYLSRVAAYNSRGRLNAGIPVPDITVNEYTARAALKNVKASLANKTAIDPNDIRILDTKAGQSVLSKEGNSKIRSLIYKNAKSPEVELLNKVYTGADLDPSNITAIVENDQLLSTLPNDTRLALREAYDDILYQSLANAENRVEAANNILSKLRTPKYRQQILDEVTPPKPAVTPEPTPTPEPAAAAESVTIEATPQPAAPARPQTLAERWMEIYPDTYNIKFGRPGKKFETWRSGYNTISDANGNIVPNKIGLGGNTFTLTESGGRPMISGEISPGDLYNRVSESVYNPKWYSVADQGADPNLGKVRKWFWKPAENLNAKVRTNQGDITITGPGVSRTKLSNWLLGITGLGAVGIGVPTLWGLGKSVFSGDSTSERPVIHLFDGRNLYFDQGTVNSDTTAFLPYGGYEWIPIGEMGDGNYGQMREEAALTQDTQKAMNEANQNNSIGKASTQRRNNDSIPINQ